jgi:hypothetical protein
MEEVSTFSHAHFKIEIFLVPLGSLTKLVFASAQYVFSGLKKNVSMTEASG